jgi:D-beta-D-heptose 7-phosphate kinase / D-beta-D-heptose 1-phosphate adenosyltransferase
MNYLTDCLDELEDVIFDQQRNPMPLVLCTGCFDLLHAGHIKLLEAAERELHHLELANNVVGCGRLVVALNTDESVRCLKGQGRPIYPLEQRAVLLAALRMVDYVIPFGGEPIPIIEQLKPHIYVKGDDWDELRERETVEGFGGRVVLVERLPRVSTTDTLFRTRMN